MSIRFQALLSAAVLTFSGIALMAAAMSTDVGNTDFDKTGPLVGDGPAAMITAEDNP